ncbi:uncharacterized protein BO80DRAFT_468843 [Aspergillus ibericus CBS 121593]|uniref:Uncharacterized protein n=1 Tax=Aspergillus ibericus CBS 121593 TaxID=1448316 RepID=A0A395GL40_9EURO|nr:hypothetical protein BO80DRAFT_468843 [Aspergillus ibericus CBS 121593]RAK96104.1 hypothetical protein BO80DRAFT_468843 [Aspergillus ibericus CBS 121593]
MSGSPRPVQRRRKRDSTTQALEHLNGLMNTQKRPVPIAKPHASTPHPSRRFTYSGKRDSPDHATQLPSPKTLPTKPRRAPPTELLTPRRSFRISAPLIEGPTPAGSTRTLRHHEIPEVRHGIGEQLEEPNEEVVPEETSAGNVAHTDGGQTESKDQAVSDEPSDDELGREDEGAVPANDEMLDGEGLRSEVELFSDDDNQTTFAQSRPPSSSGHETPTRMQPERPQDAKKGINSEPVQPNGDVNGKKGKDTPEQPADRQHSHSSGLSPTNRTPMIAVEITRIEEYSSSISVMTEGHHSSKNSMADNARISDQGANIGDATLDEDSIFQPPEDSSSSVPSPDPSSSESDSERHSARTSPEAPSPPRHSNKRKRAVTSYQEATSQVNIQPERESPWSPQEASPLVFRNNRLKSRRSHSQEDPTSHHATQSVQEELVAQEPIGQGEPAAEEPPVQEQGRRPERLEESSWFKEASELDDQGPDWKKLIQTVHNLEKQSRRNRAADFAGIMREISCLIATYTDIVDNLRDEIGPSNHDVRACAVSLKKIAMQGRGHLEDVYNLSTEGNKDRSGDLVEGFEGHVIPLLVQLILVCFQAYYAKSKLFPEAYNHLHQALEGLLGCCDQIHGLIKGSYVHCRAFSLGVRLPLRQLIKSFEHQRLKRRHLSQSAESDVRNRTVSPTLSKGQREWTDEEGHALVEGLQRFQGPNRYYQICSFYSEGIGKRGMREVRKESERLYHRILPQIRESVRTDKGRQEWGWLLKVRD